MSNKIQQEGKSTMSATFVEYGGLDEAEVAWTTLSAEGPFTDARMTYPGFRLWASHYLPKDGLRLLGATREG